MVSMRIQELPKASQDGPKMFQDGSCRPQHDSKRGQDGPKGTQGDPKIIPRGFTRDQIGFQNRIECVSKNSAFSLYFYNANDILTTGNGSIVGRL